ncbi:hypothetical protein [Clostridium intestinale]|uniref:hypothetical protein n=1 Tax=Clostridium intestinale TaxID=36845 RepID=UPI002DD63F72|nr:hypothetical protein [Clostridium intestinale]WRY49499.1 hypothetical protein P8F83_12260 [Clostridium intestinale]
MDIEEDLKLCREILEQYMNLSPEDGVGAFKLSQLALSMYDRLNEIRIQVNTVKVTQDKTKSDLKEYIRSKMKVMEYVHVESRAIFNSINNDVRKFSRS